MGEQLPRRYLAYFWIVAVAFKLTYFLQYANLPFLEGPLFDSLVYWRQAEAVRSFDFGHATLLAYSPLYGYVLAVLGLAGPAFVAIVQLAAGLGAMALMMRIARAVGGDKASLFAGLVYLGYGPLVFFETKMMSETLGLGCLAVALFLYVSPRFARGDLRVGIACGVAVGLTVLARASLLISLPFWVAFALVAWSREEALLPRRVRLHRAGALVLGTSIVLCINGLWNLSHVGRFVPVILVSNTAARSNQVGEWTGKLSVFAAEGSGDVSAWDVVHQAEVTLGRRPAAVREPDASRPAVQGSAASRYLQALPKKLFGAFSDTETTFDYGYYGERTEVLVLAALPLSFGAVLLLALLGAAGLAREKGPRALVPYLPVIVGTLLLVTLFHPSTRYRLPMLLPMILLAAHAPRAMFQAAAYRKPLVAVVGIVCTLFAVRLWTWTLQSPALWQLRVAEAAISALEMDVARDRIARARAIAPNDPVIEHRIGLITGKTR